MNKKLTLLQKFVAFNTSRRLAGKKKNTLLAVSGGMDSVAMCELFHQAGFPFAIAHCNFQLRGKEADEDEAFVKSLGGKYKVEVFSKRFETKVFAEERKLSIQVAARELRYQWFEELRKEKGFRLVATAHHLNDNIETIIYNLAKGTGIRGLRGIPVRKENIIRPMLFASREEIEAYVAENKLSFREDSSNAEDKYARNKIRHHIIPLLKEINPSLESTLAEKIDVFTELETLYERSVKKSNAQLFLKRKGDIYIPLLKLKKMKNASSVLFEFLKDYGFNPSQVEEILASIDATSGKQFLSNRARIIKDRRFFILTTHQEKDFTYRLLEESDSEVMLTGKKLLVSNGGFKAVADNNIAFLDKSKLTFPLVVRRWRDGDYFYPFGMKMKKKKLKKFFVDTKVPLHEKENIWVVESDKRIVWVAGYRLDERFKVTPSTTKVLKLRLQ